MKRFISLILASCLVMAITACGAKVRDQAVQEENVEATEQATEQVNNIESDVQIASEENHGNVTVDVTKDITIDIANDDAKRIIKTLNDNGSFLLYADRANAYSVDENDTVYVENFMNKMKDENKPKSVLSFGLERIPNKELANLGYIVYSLQNDEIHSCEGLSLFPGWDGDMSKVDKYLNDDTSVLLENNLTIDQRIAVFKDGEIVPISELMDTYGAKAQEIAKYDQLVDYFSSNDMTYENNAGMNCVPGNLISDMQNGKHSIESIAMYCALYDWGSEYSEGGKRDFGFIYWYPELEGVQVTIACSLDDYDLLKNAKQK